MPKKIDYKKKINQVKQYVVEDLWSINTWHLPKYKKFIVKLVRTIILAYRGFVEDKVNLRASSLTYFSLLSVVPVMALIFGFAKGFGLDTKLETVVLENFKNQEEIAQWILKFASSMLQSVKGGWIIGVGLIFLIWTVMKVLGNIENSFNGIWQVKKPRVFFRKFSDYIAMMLFAPILFIMSSSAQVAIIKMLNIVTTDSSIIGYVGPFITFLIKIIPYILIWLLFTLVYVVMPNTKVKFGSAFVAGIIAGSAFQLLQWGYFHFQIGFSKYNTIYAGFAALPLFMVWLNWSWLIVLFGAEISFSIQNQHEYEYEHDLKNLSLSSKQFLSIYIVHFIVKKFKNAEKPSTALVISEELKLPVKIVNHLIYSLIECNLLVETTKNANNDIAFLPACDIEYFTVHFVIDKLNNNGLEFEAENNDKVIKSINNILDNFKETIKKSSANIRLQDI